VEDVVVEAGENIFLIVSALFPIVNPLGGTPIFLSLTKEYSTSTRRALSWWIAIYSLLLLVGSYLVGTHVLAFFGISLPVVQVGGGLMIISSGWAMLKGRDEDKEERHNIHQTMRPQDTVDRAFYPLTFPLTVGPGSISVAIALGANAPPHYGDHHLVILAAIIGSLVIAVSIFLCYGFAENLSRIMGPTAMDVIMRLCTFLLICIGMQIMWNGVSALITSVPLHLR
jgi:multiple antibiotic resistance protein